jgi:peroxiredoxin
MASTKNIERLNENIKLSDYSGKWLVLLFYPLDFTFVARRFHRLRLLASRVAPDVER